MQGIGEVAHIRPLFCLFTIPSCPIEYVLKRKHGLFIVMTRGQGSDELVGEDNGIAVDVSQFAEKVIWLYRHPEERRRFGMASERFVNEQFTWDRVAEAYNALFRKIDR